MATNSIPNADMDAAFADLGFTFNEGDSKMTNTTTTQREVRQAVNHKRMFRLALENFGEVAAIKMLEGRINQQGHHEAAFRMRQALELLNG